MRGGVIYSYNGIYNDIGSTFENNTAPEASVVELYDANSTFIGSSFMHNVASDAIGAIRLNSADLRLDHCLFEYNSASGTYY